VVSVGGRPNYPNTPGAKECCISSDDIFSLDHDPGKTLVIGASYIALECAGFLHAFGYDTTIMVRSILLRGFDQQIAGLVGQHMEKQGIKFIKKKTPSSFEKTDNGKVKVTYDGGSDEFDTVLLAIGRYPDLEGVNLAAAGVEVHPKSGKILTKNEQTNVEHIYAIGDCIDGVPELTPSAIQAGRLLARRLFNNGKVLMDYEDIATTVFTPMEYGVIGLSEEIALERYGEKDIEVYHVHWKPLKWCVDPEIEGPFPYAKIICVKSQNQKIVGFHYLGPNAGEVTQGFGAALKLGITYDQLVETVGIHPTDAETVVGLTITKSSGESPSPPGC
jgi:thioredoxin reductase (NADPH)